MKKEKKIYLIYFFIVFSFFILLCIYAKYNIKDFRKEFINFDLLNENQRVILNGLSREQIGQMKISYLENRKIPDIGIFGNHQIQYWHDESFKKANYDGKVFNFWFANLSITDFVYYLSWLEKRSLLPKEKIIIQMTTPNNDNGNFIVGSSKELPLYILKSTEDDNSNVIIKILEKFYLYPQVFYTWIKKTFDYTTLLIGLLNNNENGRILNISDCKNNQNNITVSKYIPSLITKNLTFFTSNKFCKKEDFKGTMLKDGSIDDTGYDNVAKLNQNPLDNSELHLNQGDSKILKKELDTIIQLAERNALKIVILIPPVYEVERYSIVNQIVDNALKDIPEKFIIDHRRLYLSRDFFINYDHPNKKYFDKISKEILNKTKLN